jgi:hypothetical protein
MWKRPGALLLTLTLAAFAYGFQTDAGWTKVEPEAGRFSVLMPGTPEAKVNTTDSQYGPYTVHLFTFHNPRGIYMAGWVDYAPTFKFDVQGEINANRDNFLKGVNARLLTEKKITLDGNPGLEFTAESNDVQFIKSRVYIVGSRPYQLITLTNLKEEQANVDKFLASFKITAGK